MSIETVATFSASILEHHKCCAITLGYINGCYGHLWQRKAGYLSVSGQISAESSSVRSYSSCVAGERGMKNLNNTCLSSVLFCGWSQSMPKLSVQLAVNCSFKRMAQAVFSIRETLSDVVRQLFRGKRAKVKAGCACLYW